MKKVLNRLTLAALPFVIACAGMTKVEDKRLAQIPPEEKQEVFAARHNLQVAEANLDQAKKARERSDQYQEAVKDEEDAAKNEMERSRKAIKLAQEQGNGTYLEELQRDQEVASLRLQAAKAHKNYADDNKKFLDKYVKTQEQAVDVTMAKLELTQGQALRKQGQKVGELGDLENQLEKEKDHYLEATRDLEQQRGTMEASRDTWLNQRREYVTAAAGHTPRQLQAPEITPETPYTPVEEEDIERTRGKDVAPWGEGEKPSTEIKSNTKSKTQKRSK